ncbi:MAG: AbrB/MazE/SpoVT family DNA-binding domain-containing protein [Pseudomonadota bacterium]
MEIEAKVTSKGQITLPKKLRDELGVNEGDAIKFVRDDAGNYAVKRKQPHPINDLRGILKHDGPPLSSDEIVELVRLSREGRGAQFLDQRKKRGS